MNRIIPLAILTVGFIAGAFVLLSISLFRFMPVDQMHHHLPNYQRRAIEKAKDRGDYTCCYQPGCTMCFMSANQWNDQQAGHCDCAEFIAQGKQPCPECVSALKQEINDVCDLDDEQCY